MFSMTTLVVAFVCCFISILLAFAIHEYAHAITAYKLGDPTPKYEGRITLNPFVHLDVVGAIVLMLSLLSTGGRVVIGWGKPVRFNSEAMSDPILHGAMVAFAGPFSNFLLAVVAGLPVKLGLVPIPVLADALAILAGVNVALFIFNMIPFPPLDGWKVLQAFLPRSVAYQMRNVEASWGMVPMYGLMGVIYLFGGFILGPPYAFIMAVLVGRLPIQ